MVNVNESYYSALAACAERYLNMIKVAIDDNDYWGWSKSTFERSQAFDLMIFIGEFQREIQNRMPLNKLNRWLGYIQGTLIAWGKTTVNEERDWTRPLFRPLDYT